MSAWESLPLLYAMRHVARDRGKGTFFWPPFHEHVLNKEITLDDVYSLSPLLGQVWTRFYRASGGALYRPNSRLANIKWPLAHAGLLPDDVEALREFGVSLHQQCSGEISAAPLHVESQEQFRLYFLDWFFGSGHTSHPRLRTLLEKEDGTEAVIAELSQHWLLEHWERLGTAGIDGRAAKALCLPGRSLRYDVTQGRLLLAFGESDWPGNGVGKFTWGRHSTVLQKSYRRDRNRSYSAHFELIVAPGDWSSDAAWEIGSERFRLPLPQPPRQSQGMIFRSDTGKAISGWQTGDWYYVLVPRECFRSEDADTLFEHQTNLGSPGNGWEDFTLLLVQTVDLLTSGSLSVLSKKDVFEAMEAATERMRLPLLDDPFRPRLSLVGGTCLQGGAEAVYDIGDPIPWLAVRGVYRPLTITLSHWEAGLSRYAPVSECVLPGAPDGGGQVVSLWEASAPTTEGLYRVEAGSAEALSFRLRHASSRLIEGSPTLNLQVSVVPDQERGDLQEVAAPISPAQRCGGVTRQELATGRLVVTGWPFADLVLRVTLGMTEKRQPVRLGADGRWESAWRSLGVRLDQPGLVRVWVLWRGVTSAEMTIADTPYVADGDIEYSHEADGVLTVSGTLSNVGAATTARIAVLRRRFWNGQVTVKPTILGSGGRFQETFSDDAEAGCWVAVIGEGIANGHREEQLWHLGSLKSLRKSAKYPLTKLFPASTPTPKGTVAIQIKGMLNRSMLPARLADELVLARFAEFLARHDLLNFQGLTLRPMWHPMRTDADWAPLVEQLPMELPLPPLVLLAKEPPPRVFAQGAEAVLKKPYLTIANMDGLLNVFEAGGGTISLARVQPGGYHSPISARAKLSHEAGQWHVCVNSAHLYLQACDQCGLVMDSNTFNSHTPPILGLLRCRSGFSSQRPDTWSQYQFGLLTQPRATIRWIHAVLMLALDDEEELPARALAPLEELSAICNRVAGEETPQRWLKRLTQLAMVLLRKLEKQTMPESSLIKLGRHVQQNEEGLNVLFRWLRDEMKWTGRDAT